MGGRSETHNEEPGFLIAETGDGTRPVGLAPVARRDLTGDLLAPGDEPGASAALDHLGGHAAERIGHRPRVGHPTG
jgi:hypothetical protein